MFRTFALLVCLLPLSVSAGELDGKSLVCERLNVKDSLREHIEYSPFHGFKFIDGKVFGETIIVVGTQAIIVESITQTESTGNPLSYKSTLNTVSWGNDYWVLDRQTLRLEGNSKSGNRREMGCEVFTEILLYNERLENLRDEKQKKIDELTKDNKI